MLQASPQYSMDHGERPAALPTPGAPALTRPPSKPPLSVNEVYDILAGFVVPVSGTERVPLHVAYGRVTAEDVLSGLNLPRFDNSAVDGYGISSADLTSPAQLEIVGAVRAGEGPVASPSKGEAVYLATGAPIPQGVAAVVMQEKVGASRRHIVLREPLRTGTNIRRAGEDVQSGASIVTSGTSLDARHLAILSATGKSTARVWRKLRIAVLSTGDELRPAGAAHGSNDIYDVNGPMLACLIASPSVEVAFQAIVRDSLSALASTFSTLGLEADVIVASGGAAGSDSDHLAAAIRAAGGIAMPLRVALRPGKPMVLGRIGKALVLGLPGNPVAALVNLMLFGRPAIAASAGSALTPPRGEAAVAGEAFGSTPGRTELVPVDIAGSLADGRPILRALGRGSSSRLLPLIKAAGFARLPEAASEVSAGSPVIYFPFRAAFQC